MDWEGENASLYKMPKGESAKKRAAIVKKEACVPSKSLVMTPPEASLYSLLESMRLPWIFTVIFLSILGKIIFNLKYS